MMELLTTLILFAASDNFLARLNEDSSRERQLMWFSKFAYFIM